MTVRNIEIGKPIKLEFHERYFQHNRGHAIRDVYDALVELVTNSDDSYHRLFEDGMRQEDGGPILIEYAPRRNKPSVISVKDRAEGMSMAEMVKKMGSVGDRQSGRGDRGFMARGAKDCTELGEMRVESIKDNKYYACRLTPNAEFIPEVNGEKVTPKIRRLLGLRRKESGTKVTLYIDPIHKVPLEGTILRDLPWHYSLRLLFSNECETQVSFKNLNNSAADTESLIFRLPEGKNVVDEEFPINGYKGAKAHLRLWKSEEAFDDPPDRRFRRSGILVKGTRAVYECTLLHSEFENDPLGKHYFGVLECPFIDKLLEDYDSIREKGGKHPEANPKLLIDPNRQSGLLREHPFAMALMQTPSEKLRALIAKDREAIGKKHKKIENRETRRRLDRLAKLATDFLEEQVEELTDNISSGEPDQKLLDQTGGVIVPSYVRLNPGQKKQFWIYMKAKPSQAETVVGKVSAEGRSVDVLDNKVELKLHPKKKDTIFGKFLVEAKSVEKRVQITVSFQRFPTVSAEVEIADVKSEFRDFDSPLEFEYENYSVKQGSTRTIKLFALQPEVISVKTLFKVWSDNNTAVEVLGNQYLIPIANSNIAQADIRITGRTLNDKATINAQVHGRRARTNVKVVEKQRGNVPIKIKLRAEDFGNFRAKWADHEGQPNLLLISSIHDSIKRYLGPSPDFSGQNSPIFRLLMAEIVAESVCRRLLTLAATERPWEFQLADLAKDKVIVDTVIARLHKALRDFVSLAHEAMLSATEVSRASQ